MFYGIIPSLFIGFFTLFFAVNTSYAQSASEIFEQYKNIRKSFKIDETKGVFNEESSSLEKLDISVKSIQQENASRISKLVSDSYHYLLKNKKNTKIKKTREYRRVLALANKLRNYKRLNERLGDDGCLANKDEEVRALSNSLLLGTLASELPGCEHIEKDDQEADSLLKDIAKADKQSTHHHNGHSASHEAHELVEVIEVYVKFGEAKLTSHLLSKYGIAAAEATQFALSLAASANLSEEAKAEYDRQLFKNISKEDAMEAEAIIQDELS